MDLPLRIVIIRLTAAVLFGGMLGVERERREHPAGLRTHAIVSLGAAIMMLVSMHGFGDVLAHRGVDLDPSRVAAQVVSGIGFLGAGVIFAERFRIHGLTTAAGLWLVSGIGLACGSGLLEMAGVATVLALIILGPVKRIEERLFPTRNRQSGGRDDG